MPTAVTHLRLKLRSGRSSRPPGGSRSAPARRLVPPMEAASSRPATLSQSPDATLLRWTSGIRQMVDGDDQAWIGAIDEMCSGVAQVASPELRPDATVPHSSRRDSTSLLPVTLLFARIRTEAG